MIPAAKGGAFGRAIAAYVERKVRRAFRGVWLRGTLPAADAPLLVYANHCGFWDGFVAHAVCRAAGWDGYCMTEERTLRRYRFLARLGAFSVRRDAPGDVLAAMRYATALLSRPGTAVVVFPEGELRAFGAGPVRVARGIELLARRADATCVPVAIRYAFFEHELPDVLVDVGRPHPPVTCAGFAARLEALVGELAAAHGTAGFARLVRGRRSVAERWDVVRGLPVAT